MSVKTNEVAVVTALIEEKSRLADEKKQLKRNCIDEKKNLDDQLEKARQRREAIEDEEHSSILQ